MAADNLVWCSSIGAWARVLEHRTLFRKQVARVVAEGSDRVHSVPLASLSDTRPFDLNSALSAVAGARIWSALGSDLFLAPLVSKVIPLPHQFRVLRRALETFPVRMMLADEVGMGKTIEAGLILKELKLRGLVERVLVLAPKSLLLQWIAELDALFDEPLDLVLAGAWGADISLRSDNNWKHHNQAITSIDSVKPKETQRGWSADKIARYNLERFHDLIGAGWDMVIIDECHKAAGASEDVSRYELARDICKAVPHILLLTATPHSGKSDAFQRLLSLIDPATFASSASPTRELVQSVVIRTEKRTARDGDGRPLFAPRSTRLVRVPFQERHALQQELYEAVCKYVVEGYNRALRTGDKGSRLLLILIQRLMSSSTHAIRGFLERRIEVLTNGRTDLAAVDDEDLADDTDMDELAATVLFQHAGAQERKDVERLLGLAVRVEQTGPDARTEELYDQMLRLAQEDSEPSKKFLVFTEFTATQEMLIRFLEGRGYVAAALNGAMDLAERKEAQESFREGAQVLVSTDAGGEGLNMQFAHVVFNYDLPWNPMRVEQRIGRLDRIGQKRSVKAINLVLENSVEARLHEIWQEKLATILTEFGVDKTGDVLDSSEAEVDFERLARTALLTPDALEHEIDRLVMEIRKSATKAKKTGSLFTSEPTHSDAAPTVPLRAWLDTMMGMQHRRLFQDSWDIDLSKQLVERINTLRPFFAEGKPVPVLKVTGLGFELDGWFSIWKIGIADAMWRQQQVFSLYATDDGVSYNKSAQRLWDEMATRQAYVQADGETLDYDYRSLQEIAEGEAEEVYDSVVRKTRERARQRMAAAELSYRARGEAIARIGLLAVQETRRRELELDHQQRTAEIALSTEALPDLQCLFLARVRAE